MTYLVCFSKYDSCGELIVDSQFHVFDKCLTRVEFIHDELFKAFMNKGYLWSAVPFNLDLAYHCGFTISNCCED